MDNMGWDDPRFGEVPATVSALMRFPQGRVASFTCSFGAAATDTFTVVGSEDHVTMHNAFSFQPPRTLTLVRGRQDRNHSLPPHRQFQRPDSLFLRLHSERPKART